MGPLLRAASESIAADGPAIGLIEVQSIARGITVADAMVKRAAVRLVLNRPVSPGKHLSLCTGDVGDVEEAMTAGLARAGSSLCDQLMLSQVHAEVLRALGNTERSTLDEALSIGILETFSAAAVLLGADAACKATDVHLYEIRLCDGLGGKGFAIFSGEQDLVEAALATAQEKLNPGLYLGHELIARPHPDLIESLLRN
jgi:microcompartment protein CcmL/EutN